tara:strand:- start:215 stop:637 length:423 start_codon:yes stop_codon:yes gene_type:complete
MIFLTIPDIKGQTFTINPNQISLIMESPKHLHGKLINDEFWIVIGKHSIEITEEIYTDLLRHIDRVTIDVAEPLQDKVEDLEFTVRTANCLYNADIIFVHQLLRLTQTDLLKMKNMGRKSLNEIREKLADKYNAKLKGDQ